MKKSDRESFRNELLEQRRQVLEHSAKLNSVEVVGADGVPDFADYAADKAEVGVTDRIADSEHKLLEKIELALQRLEEGNYDICAECGGKIPIARLRAKPAASLCIECPWGVMRLDQIGIPAVALLGTHLSAAQRQLLLPTPRLIVMMDGDSAGRRAASRIRQQMQAHPDLLVASIPDGLDPDDLTDEQLAATVQPLFF